MTVKQISLPITVVIAVVSAAISGALGAGIVRSDVNHLAERIIRSESAIESVTAEVSGLKMVQAGDSARDAEWRLAVERRLGAIESSLTDTGTTLQEVRTLLRRARH